MYVGPHPRFGTPYRTTIATVVFVICVAGFVPLADLADLVSIGTLFALLLVLAGGRGAAPDPARHGAPVPGAVLAVAPDRSALACLYLATNLSIETWLRFLVWLAIGMAIYFGYGRRHARLARASSADTTPSAS